MVCLVYGGAPCDQALESIVLAKNNLCGMWYEGLTICGNYNAEGVKALFESIMRHNHGVKCLDLRNNGMAAVDSGRLFNRLQAMASGDEEAQLRQVSLELMCARTQRGGCAYRVHVRVLRHTRSAATRSTKGGNIFTYKHKSTNAIRSLLGLRSSYRDVRVVVDGLVSIIADMDDQVEMHERMVIERVTVRQAPGRPQRHGASG